MTTPPIDIRRTIVVSIGRVRTQVYPMPRLAPRPGQSTPKLISGIANSCATLTSLSFRQENWQTQPTASFPLRTPPDSETQDPLQYLSDSESGSFYEDGRRRSVPWEACQCTGVHTKHLRHWETACPFNPNRERFPCGIEGCRKSFARADGRKRHWDKFHDRREPESGEL